MASKRYRVTQEIELAQLAQLAPVDPRDKREKTKPNREANAGRYRWSLAVHVDENGEEASEAVFWMKGKAPSESAARDMIEKFTKLTLKSYDLLGHSKYSNDDDDEEED